MFRDISCILIHAYKWKTWNLWFNDKKDIFKRSLGSINMPMDYKYTDKRAHNQRKN